MIPAVIIIIALALAFIILIRRLPKTTDLPGSQTPPPPPEPTQLPSIPKISLPDLSKLTLPRITLPKVTLPVLPTIQKRQQPAESQETAEQPAETADPFTNNRKDEFWQELEEAKPEPQKPARPAPAAPIAPVTPSLPTPPAPRPLPTPPVATPTKNRGRDVFQEAEDAFAIKDYKKAERLYLRLATENPRNAKVYGRLGVIYLEQKNYDDARDALQAAIKLEPNIASRHFNLALTYLELGSHAKAVTAMESALKYDPSNRKYRKMLDEIMNSR